jgi:hypothetical protein
LIKNPLKLAWSARSKSVFIQWELTPFSSRPTNRATMPTRTSIGSGSDTLGFIYIDRVIVAAGTRGRGVAASLDAKPFAAALDASHELVASEVSLDPPNA